MENERGKEKEEGEKQREIRGKQRD